jgi:homopolymeric O-antigen transport system permease protein
VSEHSSQVEAALPGQPAAPTVPTEPVDPAVRVTLPAKRRVKLREVWTTLPVAWMLGRRDMKIKYKQSALGPLWLVLQPLAMLTAIAVAFSAVTNVNTGNIPYVVFALAGLAVWTYVQFTFAVAPNTLPSNQLVVRRSPCPRVALVSGTLISVLPPLGVVLIASIGAAAITGHLPIQAVLVPVMIIWLLVFMWGVTLLTAALAARFRDVIAFSPLVVQAGIFLTPVGYPLNTSEQISNILIFNPVSGLLEAWRWSLLGIAPDMTAVAFAGGFTVALVWFGWYVFGRMETRFADYV